MSRGLSDAQNTYLAGDALITATLVEIGINGGTNKYYTTAPFDITYNGDTYEAQGTFMGFGESSETAELNITSMQLVISAIDVTNVRELANSNQINQIVNVWKVFLDPTDNSLIGDSAGDEAILIFQGRIGSYKVENATDSATIQLDVSSQFKNFQKTSGRRTNISNLQREHSTDWGFQYAHEGLRDIKWGKK